MPLDRVSGLRMLLLCTLRCLIRRILGVTTGILNVDAFAVKLVKTSLLECFVSGALLTVIRFERFLVLVDNGAQRRVTRV